MDEFLLCLIVYANIYVAENCIKEKNINLEPGC
jgi:hypothetical protein